MSVTFPTRVFETGPVVLHATCGFESEDDLGEVPWSTDECMTLVSVSETGYRRLFFEGVCNMVVGLMGLRIGTFGDAIVNPFG